MRATIDAKLIRKRLRFLFQADRELIKAADILEKLEGDPKPQGPEQLLKKHSFQVGDTEFKNHKMTKEQAEYLKDDWTGSFKQFAKGLAKILVKMDKKLGKTLTDLADALAVPTRRGSAAKARDSIDPQPTGACYYDGTECDAPVTQSFCDNGLQGTSWVQGKPCNGGPP